MTTIIRLQCIPVVEQDSHGAFTAVCEPLGLAAMGQTKEEALINLKMTIESYCNVLRRRGVLERALNESGISFDEIPFEQNPGALVVDITP